MASGVESPRDLRATEAAVGEESTVLSRERYSLSDALIDDIGAHLGETVNVGFTRSEVAAFHGVVKETVDAVPIVLIILCRVDAPLGGDAMGAPGAVLKTEAVDVVAELRHCSRGRSAR